MAIEILFGIILFFIFYLVFTYNNLVTLRTRIDNAWSQIDVFLKRRYDLIPNLVETVKGYAKHEKETLTNLTKARSGLITGNPSERGKAYLQTSNGIKTLFAVAEAYPDLKANEIFLRLQEELLGTENSIAYVRIGYNDTVLAFNIAIQSFPSNIIANMFGFKSKDFFQTISEEQKAIKIDLTK